MYPVRQITTNIQLLRSSIANKRPAPATLLEGQAAVNLNTTEPGLYFKLSSGVLTKIGPTCVNSSGSAPNATPAGSSGSAVGESWLDARSTLSSPVLKVYDGSVWRTSSGFVVNDATGDYGLAKGVTVRNLISNGTGANSYIQLNSGPTTDQSAITAANGMIRYDSTTDEFVGYYGGSSAGWRNIGPSTYVDITLTGDTVIGTNCLADTLTIQSSTTFSCDILASPDNTVNLGSPTKRFANIYTGDLHFSNEGSNGNDVDGTTGNWTLQEGDKNMYFINNKTGAKFRVVMESVG